MNVLILFLWSQVSRMVDTPILSSQIQMLTAETVSVPPWARAISERCKGLNPDLAAITARRRERTVETAARSLPVELDRR
jgi:hypothetical protein